MKPGMIIMIVSLVLAIGFAISVGLLERFSSLSVRRRDKATSFCVIASVYCCYGVCVGANAAALGYFFQLPEWLVIAISVPLGVPLFLIAVKWGES